MDKVSVIEFGFSLHQREIKIREILKNPDAIEAENGKEVIEEEIVTTEDVRRRWSTHLEKSLPACPWLALAKTSHPKLVDVIEVNWCQLEAKVEDVDDSVDELPAQRSSTISLAVLFPLNLEAAAGINTGAEALDHLRFFLDHLWLPWDEDDDGDSTDDDGTNWVNEHLTLRFLAYENYINLDVTTDQDDTYSR